MSSQGNYLYFRIVSVCMSFCLCVTDVSCSDVTSSGILAIAESVHERGCAFLIELPLTASSSGPGCLVCMSSPVAVRKLTSAPVSMRNCCLETVSQRSLLQPATEATTCNQHHRFLTRCRVVCIDELLLQMSDGNNKLHIAGVGLHMLSGPKNVGMFG